MFVYYWIDSNLEVPMEWLAVFIETSTNHDQVHGSCVDGRRSYRGTSSPKQSYSHNAGLETSILGG